MPSFKKRVLSLFLRNQCERQFALYLYNDDERLRHGMPSRQQNRAGLTYVGQAGYEWQDEKVNEIRELFGAERVHEGPRSSRGRPGSIPLIDVLPTVEPYQFIVEGSYEADTQVFRQALGLTDITDLYGDNIGLGDTRPDIIQIFPAVNQLRYSPATIDQNPYEKRVLPNGELEALSPDDSRLRLRVIDIKLTSEPGAQYFAEVVYYSITLAAWLIQEKLDDRFVVIAAPAVWPGSHEASALAIHRQEWLQQAHTPSGFELFQVLEEDLELAIFDIYSPRLRQLITAELPHILATPWNELPWHVDFRCKGCEFLGYPWGNEDTQQGRYQLRCWPTAENQHNLCRVYGLSHGASEQLRRNNVIDLDALAEESPDSGVFDVHQSLRAKRTAFPRRAEMLRSGGISLIPNSGGDALMPRWPSLHIYIFLDYDLSSAFAITMGIRAFWQEPLPYGSRLQPQRKQWTRRQGEDEVFLVDVRDLEHERREFLRFLRQLSRILNETRVQDDTDANAGRRTTSSNQVCRSTYQIYLWDEAQRKQLIRLVGRHLPYILADASLHELVWLFPPPELLQRADEATRKSAITLVKPVVENTVALDVPHYYRLLDFAVRITPANLPPPNPHPLYTEPMSDLIPMERLHEYWNRASNWLEKQGHILNATRAKVYSLGLAVSWLEEQLGTLLSRQAAPAIISPQRRVAGLAPVNHLLLGFAQLDAALSNLEKITIRSMPPHEREARLKSARLERRLEGQEKVGGIEQLNRSIGLNLADSRTLFIYRMRPSSCDVNIKHGEFLVALAPEAIHGFLDQNAYTVTAGTSYQKNWLLRQTIEEAMLTAATVVAIDRVNALIALRVQKADLIDVWERSNRFDFTNNVILDPIHKDYLTDKIKLTLRGIGNPRSANNIQVAQALPPGLGNARISPETPASAIMWNPLLLREAPIQRDIRGLRQRLHTFYSNHDKDLDNSQWTAWEDALSHRLALLWGPPGTGKSRTLRAIILGAVLHAQVNGVPLRLLITANTYTAIDTVLLPLEEEIRNLIANNYSFYRVQSEYREIPPAEWAHQYPTLQNIILNRATPSQDVHQLRDSLEHPAGLVIVGITPEQLHNLAITPQSNSQARPGATNKEWFDIVIIDEASQMDVAASTLVFSKLASTGACILAGDDLQLPPIHQATPPEGLEAIVGSVYFFFRHHHGIEPRSLDINYRSNNTITEFTRRAGYSQTLQSYSPDLALALTDLAGPDIPQNWPGDLYWTSAWQELLDPAYPTVSFVYQDMLSSQVNQFEADSVAAMLWLLRHRLTTQLLNERRADGSIIPASSTLHEPRTFWERAVGIVTPHKAQMAKVVNRLRQVFPQDPVDSIYSAVDTVERYQGQQRDIIIGSFGMGDPDLIRGEDEFLFNLNRFNVMVSRARAKVIVLLTRSMLQYLSDDIQVLTESRLLKHYVESFCDNAHELELGFINRGNVEIRRGQLRRH